MVGGDAINQKNIKKKAYLKSFYSRVYTALKCITIASDF